MKGLELSKEYYQQLGKKMLEEEFSYLLPKLAVGFIGRGSEKLGFDDEISTDHDFEPGFCIFIPSEDVVSRRDAFLLERAYAKLPREFKSYKRVFVSPVGGNRLGVLRIDEFFEDIIGSKDGKLNLYSWLSLPDQALLEATSGEVFFDNYGQLTSIRDSLKTRPVDVSLKKLAGNMIIMAQAGQYNFDRCIKHGERASAQLSLYEFVKAAVYSFFILSDSYMPYYKWQFRALQDIDKYGFSDLTSKLLFSQDEEEKRYLIEEISNIILTLAKEKAYTQLESRDLERQGYEINNKISDSELRNLNILSFV